MKGKTLKTVLAVAGSDSGGGAGVQADIKTITVHGKYAMSVITAVTAQNTTGVYGIRDIEAEFVGTQLDSVFSDIFPDAVKIGMISNASIAKVIAEKLREYGARNIVLDPVMAATSGSSLIKDDTIDTMVNELFPLASVITPNIPEAEALAGSSLSNTKPEALAVSISELAKSGRESTAKPAVLLKGGHLADRADDLLYLPEDRSFVWFKSEKIHNPNTHGTGCTLSSSIACGLADGLSVTESVKNAKEYVKGAIGAMLDMGRGRGPLNHMYRL